MVFILIKKSLIFKKFDFQVFFQKVLEKSNSTVYVLNTQPINMFHIYQVIFQLNKFLF